MVFKTKWGFFGFLLVLLLVAVGSYWFAPGVIAPLALVPASVLSLLGTLFVVTLFVERAQEVILTNWRAFGSEALDLKRNGLRSRIARIEQRADPSDEHELREFQNQLAALDLEKLRYRAQTRIYALRIGIVMGVAVSLAGVRTLGALMPEPIWAEFALAQQLIFHTLDIVITGGVIAGGSDGVHKMAELYRVTVESRSRMQRADP
jgi:hypothetical protein